MLTQSRLKTLLNYDPDTGVFTWLGITGRRARTGDLAGTTHREGYRHVQVAGRRYQAHRLAWLYMTGAFPVAGIDHINGIRDDNRMINLREATQSENHQNRAKRSDNKSGFIGVSRDSGRQKWRAYIKIQKRNKHLGYFDSPEAAHAAYLAAKARLHTFNPTVRA